MSEHVYVGLEDCGCIVGVAVDDAFTDRKALARETAKWIRGGLSLERWTMDRFREAGHFRRHKAGKHPVEPGNPS